METHAAAVRRHGIPGWRLAPIEVEAHGELLSWTQPPPDCAPGHAVVFVDTWRWPVMASMIRRRWAGVAIAARSGGTEIYQAIAAAKSRLPNSQYEEWLRVLRNSLDLVILNSADSAERFEACALTGVRHEVVRGGADIPPSRPPR